MRGRAAVLALLVVGSIAGAGEEGIFEPKAKLREEAGGGVGGEGPAWHPRLGVFTSGNGHVNLLEPSGKSRVFRQGAGTNGLMFDPDGNLVMCEPVARRVTRLAPDGQLTVLTDRYEGKKYNSPNDLTMDSRGRIYFSDPRYGPREGMEVRDGQGRTVEGVYRIDPDGTVRRVLGREVERANGVLVSADDRALYVAEHTPLHAFGLSHFLVVRKEQARPADQTTARSKGPS